MLRIVALPKRTRKDYILRMYERLDDPRMGEREKKAWDSELTKSEHNLLLPPFQFSTTFSPSIAKGKRLKDRQRDRQTNEQTDNRIGEG